MSVEKYLTILTDKQHISFTITNVLFIYI